MAHEYAVVDGEGRYGDAATVYHVGDRASCEGVAADGRGLQVVQYSGVEVGESLTRVAVAQGSARYDGAVTAAKEAAAWRRKMASERAAAAQDPRANRGR